jgi:hypothetical protein
MSPAVRAERATPALPWPVGDLVRLYVVNATVLVALVITWWVAAGTVRGGREVGALAVAIGGLIVSGGINALWLMVGRRSVSARRVALRSDLDDLIGAIVERAGAESEITPLPVACVTLENGSRYHRPGCELVAGKRTIAWSSADADARWRVPCGVCRP